MDTNVLVIEQKNAIATITFNRPDAFNSLDVELAQALRDACQSLAENDSVKVVILKGAGRAFMAGGDLHALREAPVDALNQLIPPVHEAVEYIANMPKPVIACVHGAAAGAGLSIALAADFVIAADSARFSFAYSDIAASGDAGITWTLPRLVGMRQALAVAMLGTPMRMEQAQRLDLVTQVVAADELEVSTLALAEQLAARATYALGHIKKLIRQSQHNTLKQQLDAEYASFVACAQQPEFTQAIDAFFAKRGSK